MPTLFKNLRLIQNSEIQEPQDYLFDKRTLQVSHADLSELEGHEIIDAAGYFLSPGWIDLRCGSGDPGLEYKETLESFSRTLQASGFSAGVLLPNTEPVIQSKSDLDYIFNRTSRFSTRLFVQAAVTKGANGEDLTEILDMHYQAGAHIFGDGSQTLANSDRFMKILQYLQRFDGILFDHSYDPLLALFGKMHEGQVSTHLGMKGIPNLAEELAIHRNIEILRYAGGRLHFQTISTAKSVQLIRQAKADGLRVTCDVSIYQLLFSDEDLKSFDPNYKVMPPFRGADDRAALLEGLRDGTIDALVSNHQPQDFDSKFMEFDLASFGMAGLVTFLPALVRLESELSWPLLIGKITAGARNVIGDDSDPGWTIFDPNECWTYARGTNPSRSANHPWFGQDLLGRVKYVVQKGELLNL